MFGKFSLSPRYTALILGVIVRLGVRPTAAKAIDLEHYQAEPHKIYGPGTGHALVQNSDNQASGFLRFCPLSRGARLRTSHSGAGAGRKSRPTHVGCGETS